MQISVKADIDSMMRRMTELQRRQMPFAVARALTKVAQIVQKDEVKEMIDVFDRPTPWTLNSVAIKPATKTNLTSFVWIKDAGSVSTGTPAEKYLAPEIKGGSRELKRFEAAFRSAGILPSSMFMVPGEAAKIDRFGNLARGQIVQLLSYFQAFPQGQGFTANLTAERKARLARGTKKRIGFEYFVLREKRGELQPGIWQRFRFASGSSIKPVVIFVDSAHYEAIFDFGFVAKNTVEREMPRQLQESMAIALSTAKP